MSQPPPPQNEFLKEFGLTEAMLIQRGLRGFGEAVELVLAETSRSGKEHYLIAETAEAWCSMRRDARLAGIHLSIVSGFRSYEYQAGIIRRKLANGLTLENILSLSAPPGFSEHHTGRAIDIGTPGVPPLTLLFEQTPAFSWLSANAEGYGFRLSYPPNNPQGFLYEPWHWCHAAEARPCPTLFTTRIASKDDEDFIFTTYCLTMRNHVERTWGWDEEKQKNGFWKNLPLSGFQIILVEENPVGALFIESDETRPADNLRMLLMQPNWQNRGIGTAVLARAIESAHAHRRRVELRVIKNNPARKLYDRLGFAVVGEDENTWTMVR